ncbi:MAG: NAD(P)-binding domain-containing protein [Oscillospiraceae bacterium]|nr:NAD(P)-binding domain-containing protein [Oscillospiraceae bacterium]
MQNKKILIIGAGVIGSIFAVKLSEAGHNVSLFARSKRLEELTVKGLLYKQNGLTKKANVNIISQLDDNEHFDFIFVTVRYNQIESVLEQLKNNVNSNIVTMVNNINGYDNFEKTVGKGKIIPAFPGAGGRIENGILTYKLTPKTIQSTTIGEINGEKTERIISLQKLIKSAKIPTLISKNMDLWQKSHLALVTALANGIYYDGGDNYTTAKNKKALHLISVTLKSNFKKLKNSGVKIEPFKLNIIRFCPIWIMDLTISFIFKTEFAEICISSHAINAKEEMQILDRDFKKIFRTIKREI